MSARNRHILMTAFSALPVVLFLYARDPLTGTAPRSGTVPPRTLSVEAPSTAGADLRAEGLGSLTEPEPVPPDTLLWPLQAEPGLTSSFGEYRAGHIHAGIDVKTWGRMGVPSVAVADGSIRRVRTSPWGYGKALYFEMADGRTAVYAHLDRFTEPIEELVRARQAEESRYSVDLWFPIGTHPVRRGEVVAYSGNTGTEAPHLHFEIRDAGNRPLNPLLEGIPVTDTVRPVIQAVTVRPIGAGARVDGGVYVRDFGAVSQGRGAYRLRGRPEVSGPVALGIVGYDLMGGVWNRFSPYRMTLEVDDRVVFRTTYRMFDLADTGYIHLDRDYPHMVRTGTRAHTLWLQSGNRLPFYDGAAEGTGILDGLASGTHPVRVRMEDVAGNTSEMTFELLVNRPPTLTTSVPSPVDRLGDGLVDVASGAGRYSDGLVVKVSDPDGDTVRIRIDRWMYAEEERTGPEDRSTAGTSPRGRWQTVLQDQEPDGEGRLVVPIEILDALTLDGPAVLRLAAEDRWGSATLGSPWEMGGPALAVSPDQGDNGQDGSGRAGLWLDIEHYEGTLVLRAEPLDGIPGQTTFTVRRGRGDLRTLTGEPAADGSHIALLTLDPAVEHRLDIGAVFLPVHGAMREARTNRWFMPVPIGRTVRVQNADGRFQITFPEDAFYADALMEVWAGDPIVEPVPALVALSPVYDTAPEYLLFKGQAGIELRIDRLPEGVLPRQVGLYTAWGQNGSRGWIHLGGALEGDRLSGQIGGLGTFAALADTACPTVHLLSPSDGARLRSRQPRILFEVTDEHAGFDDERQLILHLDGRPVIARYDPPRDHLIYEPVEPLTVGEHTVELEATDGAGNTTRLTATFTIR